MKRLWVVTLHFGRGQVQIHEYDNKEHAMRFLKIVVFDNEDCVNATVYAVNVKQS